MNDTPCPIPDYERLCRAAGRLPGLDPDAIMTIKLVRLLGEDLGSAVNASLAAHGISEGRLRILAILLIEDRPLAHSELAEQSGVTRGTITGLVDGLERDGLVRRTPSEDDRRVTLAELTREGAAHIESIMPEHLARIALMTAGLSKKEQKSLVRLLSKLRRGLDLANEAAAATEETTR